MMLGRWVEKVQGSRRALGVLALLGTPRRRGVCGFQSEVCEWKRGDMTTMAAVCRVEGGNQQGGIRCNLVLE